MSFEVGYTMMEGKLDLAAQFAKLSWTDKGDNGYDITEPDGNTIISFRGRYWNEMNQKVTLIPHFDVMFGKVAGKNYDYWEEGDDDDNVVTDKEEEKITSFDLGIGMNYTPASGILAVADFGIAYEKWTEKYTDVEDDETEEWTGTYFYLPYFRIGLDAVVFNWMDVRLGATSYWERYSSKNEYANGIAFKRENKRNSVYNTAYLGLGFHWGNFYIDTYMDPQILLDGFEFIRGNNQYEAETYDWDYRRMNYQVSLKYDMF
jgi:hypothetical protein